MLLEPASGGCWLLSFFSIRRRLQPISLVLSHVQVKKPADHLLILSVMAASRLLEEVDAGFAEPDRDLDLFLSDILSPGLSPVRECPKRFIRAPCSNGLRTRHLSASLKVVMPALALAKAASRSEAIPDFRACRRSASTDAPRRISALNLSSSSNNSKTAARPR